MSNDVFFAGDEPNSEETNRELSYLDIVTAAFGSAIFLLFVFATLPLDQAGGAGADQYIDLHIEYSGDTYVELQIARNEELVFRTLDPQFNPDPFTGQSRLPNTDDYQSVHISNASISNSEKQVIGFRIIGPTFGTWHVYANAAKARDPFATDTFQSSFVVDVRPSCALPCEPKTFDGSDLSGASVITLNAGGNHEPLVKFEIREE